MVKKIEVGKLYRSFNSVIFVLKYHKFNNEYVFYALENPDDLLARYKDDAHLWWDHV
jgi:hypothetical protein